MTQNADKPLDQRLASDFNRDALEQIMSHAELAVKLTAKYQVQAWAGIPFQALADAIKDVLTLQWHYENDTIPSDPKQFVFHSDEGHGWLSVTLSDIGNVDLHVSDFSRYSYRDGNTVYLEEDQDAFIFSEAYRHKYGHSLVSNETRASLDADSFIRGLERIGT